MSTEVDTNRMHLALAFDQNYIVPFYVLLTSIFVNNKGALITIHVIATGISDIDKKAIEQFVRDNYVEIYFYEIDENIFVDFIPPKNKYLTVASCYRLFFPSLLSGVTNKFLYLDIDVIVIGKISELYDQSLQLPVAASVDGGMSGTYKGNSYFNAGVMLVNIIEWEKYKVSERAIDYLIEYNGLTTYLDQDALNNVLTNNWLVMDNKFNCTFNDIPQYLPKKSYNKFLAHITVVHFTGVDKPWIIPCRNKFRFLYLFYKSLSPMAQHKNYENSRLTLKANFNVIKINLLEFINDYPFMLNLVLKTKKHLSEVLTLNRR